MTSFTSSPTHPAPDHGRALGLHRLMQVPEWCRCLAIAALWFGCTAWLRPLAMPDEGRYVGVAWEMLRRGDWLVPTLDGMPFFHKPPLFYWITAGSMALFGPGVAAARAAAWLASVTIATGLFAFVRHWVGRRQAWTAFIVLATAPLFYGAAQYANMDLLVAACISSAILLTAHAALSRSLQRPYRLALAAAFVAAALGVLSKGLIGVVLPLLVLVGWGLATRRLGALLGLLTWVPGWLLFAAVAAPWFVAMQQRFPDFGHYFFVVQHFQRFASTGFNNAQPWYFYPLVLLALTLPWSPWLVAGWRRRAQVGAGSGDLGMLMWAWVITVVVFFSWPASKLVGYVLPALAPLAFLIAEAVGRATQGRGQPPLNRWLATTAALAATACVALTTLAHFVQPKSHQAIAEVLHVVKRPAERVFFLDNLYYDVSFYARLDAPVSVVDPWLPAEVAKDSWRRELVDASRFAPAGSPRLLLTPAELAPALCGAHPSWLVGPWPTSATTRWLTGQAPVVQSGNAALWRIDAAEPSMRAALRCDEVAASISAKPGKRS
jgi:hypothetical protein